MTALETLCERFEQKRSERFGNLPLYAVLSSVLRDAALDETLPPGEPVPSLRTLAAALHLGLATVRRAFEELVREGTFQTSPGKGTFPRAYARTYWNPFMRYEALDGKMLAYEPKLLEFRREIPPPEAAAALRLKADEEALFLLRLLRRTSDGRVTGLDYVWLRSDVFRGLTRGMLEHQAGRSLYGLYESRLGVRIRSVSDRVFALPAGRDAEKWGIPQGTPLLMVKRTARGPGGDPVEYRMEAADGRLCTIRL